MTDGGYATQLARLEARARYEPRPHHRPAEKLEPLRRLLAALEHPERGPRTVHVAGTNGKGTTAAMVARLLQSRGLRIGLYQSPHLIDIRERISIGGEMISEAAFAAAAQSVLDAAEALPEGGALSYFDLLTALAFVAFREAGGAAGLDAWVLETGLGGLADSTNITGKALAVLTPVGHDHLGVLGTSLREVAAQKLGIVPPGVPAVLAAQPPELAAWMAERLRAQGSTVWPAGRIAVAFTDDGPGPPTGDVLVQWPLAEPVRIALPLHGSNAAHLSCVATALTALDALEGEPADAAERHRRAEVALSTAVPGRQQWIDGASLIGSDPGESGLPLSPLLLDGAHNREALIALRDTLIRWRVRGYTLLLALMEDKLIEPVEAPLRGLLAEAETVVAVTLGFPRSPAPERLRAFLQRLSPAGREVVLASPAEALGIAAARPAQVAVAAGSLWMVGELLKRLRLPAGHGAALPSTVAGPRAQSTPADRRAGLHAPRVP